MTERLEADRSLAHSCMHQLSVDMAEAIDIFNAIVWLVSEDARNMTDTVVPVDAGRVNKR
jgi:hypothetical protein